MTASSPVLRWLIASLALALTLQSATGAWNVTTHRGRSYVSVGDVAKFYGMGAERSGDGFVLARDGLELRCRKGSKAITINRIPFYMSYPVVSWGKSALVSVFDVTNLIDVVLRPPSQSEPRTLKTVVIDPAHGGGEAGLAGASTDEKTVMWEIARQLQASLADLGFEAILTREGDASVGAPERAGVANAPGGETAFVSLHATPGDSTYKGGLEAYTLSPAGTPSTYDPEDTKPDLKYYLGNLHEQENMALATAVYGAVAGATSAPGNGIKRARYETLRKVKVPGIVFRLGSIGGSYDITDAGYQKKLVEGLASGIKRYAGYLAHAAREQKDADPPVLSISEFVSHEEPMSPEGGGEDGEIEVIEARITAAENAKVDPRNVEVQVYAFDVVDGEFLEPSACDEPVVEWISVLPDWTTSPVEAVRVHYSRPAPTNEEVRALGERQFFGHVLRVVYAGKFADAASEPARLDRVLHQFYPVRSGR
ncbi:hypothetical protein BH23VER1_BH23VER1_31700 [soil metagenome]